jgi:hypothetical protein
VAFNSLMIAAGAGSVVSYNIEDGEEVARITDIDAQGAEVSYFGFGPLAAGVLAAFDKNESAFRFFGVDNASRMFLPLAGGPAIEGEVQGFCFGRAVSNPAPSLFVIQQDSIHVFNLSLADAGAAAPGIAIANRATIEAPEPMAACAVESDGVLMLASEDGDIFRVENENSLAAPFATSGAGAVGGLEIVSSSALPAADGAAPGAPAGAIALLNSEDGTLALFDRETGDVLGVVRLTRKNENNEPVATAEAASVLGATGANLGALYRDGVVAVGLPEDEPSILLAPVNSVANALDLSGSAPINPRGEIPEAEEDPFIVPGLLDENL